MLNSTAPLVKHPTQIGTFKIAAGMPYREARVRSLYGRGKLIVNEHFQAPLHIYPAGDVIVFPALASISMVRGSDNSGVILASLMQFRHSAQKNSGRFPVHSARGVYYCPRGEDLW